MNEEQQVLLKNGTAMVVNSAASIGASVIVHNVSTPPIRSANREGTLVLPLCGGKFGDAFAIVRGRVLKDRKKVLKSGWNNESRRGGGINYMNYQANYPGALKESR
ncbi:hypothetical protein RUM44_011418 [Polyplax serrata]|uniref:Uncharacterized protein n=1 Tax=Polyplax serrata TaxID=468196 RepID=A0ABR1ARI3_POLSC